MTVGLRMFDMIYDMRIFESIEYLSIRYFYFSSREPLGDLLKNLKSTEEFQLLKLNSQKRLAFVGTQLGTHPYLNNVIGQIFVRYMFEKLMGDRKNECVLPLLLLYMIDGVADGGLDSLTPKQLYRRLHSDLSIWLQNGREKHWISEVEFDAMIAANKLLEVPA